MRHPFAGADPGSHDGDLGIGFDRIGLPATFLRFRNISKNNYRGALQTEDGFGVGVL